jgi:hypothetical protein
MFPFGSTAGWVGVGLVLLTAGPASAQETAGEAPPPEAPGAALTPAPDAAPVADPAPVPAAPDEEAALAAELAQIQAAEAEDGAGGGADTAATPPAGPGASSSSARGLSNLLNPAFSANGLLLLGGTTRRPRDADPARGELRSGAWIQEVELVASAIVDPYFRADVTLAGNAEEIGFEEAYLTTLELPRLTIRAGKFHANFGRHNLLHTHAYPFVTAPQPWRALLGAEGLVDAGISADLLLPLPFFAELNAQVFQGEWAPFEGSVPDDPMTPADESVPDRRRDEDLAYLGHGKTLFDLSESSTLELGGSFLGGRDGFGRPSLVAGGDLTFKWRPVEAERYRGFDWTTEVLWAKKGSTPGGRPVGGGTSAVRAQFAQRWWLQARGSVLGVPRGDGPRTLRGELGGAFVPSEFSALRLQVAAEKTTNERFVFEAFLQAIFSIGPHPSHSY